MGTKIVQMKSMLQMLAKMREFKADIDKNARFEAKSRGSRVMDEKIDCLTLTCQSLLIVTEFHAKRADTLL